MNDNIINHFFGSEDQTPVKVKVSLAAAASPAGLLVTDGDRSIVAAGEAVVVFHTVRKHFSGNISISVFQ